MLDVSTVTVVIVVELDGHVAERVLQKKRH